jgi:hypothetical protein
MAVHSIENVGTCFICGVISVISISYLKRSDNFHEQNVKSTDTGT